MKHPLWVLNSALFILVVIALLFIFFSRVAIPDREDIEPAMYTKLKKEKKTDLNFSKIYESDLFGTFKAPVVEEKPQIPTIPEPPRPQVVEVPEIPKPQFLEPIDVTLKGIFVINTNSAKNRTIIMDNKTKQEGTYRVGDKIADAQLIRIFGNKIILLRANGQQEVLYLREQDARMDAAYAMIDQWDTVIKSINPTTFMVDPQLFSERVGDLAQFIDMLHIITAYKQGKSIGCRIGGQLEDKSLGVALGLQSGDIIVSIDGIPADTMENRLKIYKNILSKKLDEQVILTLTRNKQEYVFTYILKELSPETGQAPTIHDEFMVKQLQEEEKLKIMKEKYQFAPSIQDIRQRERENMQQKGKPLPSSKESNS